MLIRVTLATSYSFAAKTRLDVLRRSLGLGTREPASPFYSMRGSRIAASASISRHTGLQASARP